MTEAIKFLWELFKILGLAFADIALIHIVVGMLLNLADNIFKGGRNP